MKKSVICLAFSLLLIFPAGLMAAGQNHPAVKPEHQATPQAAASTFFQLMGAGRFDTAAQLLPEDQRAAFLERIPLKGTSEGKLLMAVYSGFVKLDKVTVSGDHAEGTPMVRFKDNVRSFVPHKFVRQEGKWYINRF
jgi:hypothetical protein